VGPDDDDIGVPLPGERDQFVCGLADDTDNVGLNTGRGELRPRFGENLLLVALLEWMGLPEGDGWY
jgi:hypothetical protein